MYALLLLYFFSTRGTINWSTYSRATIGIAVEEAKNVDKGKYVLKESLYRERCERRRRIEMYVSGRPGGISRLWMISNGGSQKYKYSNKKLPFRAYGHRNNF